LKPQHRRKGGKEGGREEGRKEGRKEGRAKRAGSTAQVVESYLSSK
jgi:predicted transposase YdaD